jgi:hypothetical protein
LRLLALQISEGDDGTAGFALASSGQAVFRTVPASASQAAVQRRMRRLERIVTAPF